MISEAARVPISALRAGGSYRVMNAGGGDPLVDHLTLCLGSLQRLRGLIGRPPLRRGEGLLLRPCNGVHTLLMTYPIDVAFLDPPGRVTAMRKGLRPWRVTPIFAGVLATLELPAGTLDRCGVGEGVLLAFEQIKG